MVNSARSPESTLRETIHIAVREYVAGQGRQMGRKTEAPDPRNQSTDPSDTSGCPFDLLLEIDSRLLMLEVKVQVAPARFQYMGDPDQLRNLRLLWDMKVRVYYAFNIPTPCPDFAENVFLYPTPATQLEAIAGISPYTMTKYEDGEGCQLRNLKVLIDESSETLPDVISRWAMHQNKLHTGTFLIMVYNLDRGLTADLSEDDFLDLISIFKEPDRPLRQSTRVLPETIERVRTLKRDWIDAKNERGSGLGF